MTSHSKVKRKTIPRTVYWEHSTLKQVKALSKRLGVPMQVLVRMAMNKFLATKKNIKWLGVK